MSENLNRNLRAIANLITHENHFALATHILPDGDAIGSLLGLGLFLKKMNKDVCITWSKETKVPPQYNFLPGVDLLQKIEKFPFKEETFIFMTVDCSSLKRLDKLESLVSQAKKVVNIDHHPGNERFGDLNLVDEDAPASAELIFRLSKVLNVKLNKNIATCLYAGLVTDTGRFQYSNTGPRAFESAQEFLKYGLSPTHIFQQVYENISFGNLKLLGEVLEEAKFLPRFQLIYSLITQKSLAAIGANMEETEHFIDYLRAVKEARIAVILKEMSDHSLRVSLRSKDEIDVGEVARKFGGGGHKYAAAYTSQENLDATLKGLIQVLEKEENGVKN